MGSTALVFLVDLRGWETEREREGGLWDAEYLEVPPPKPGAAALQPGNLRNQAVMLAATVSDYAQEILCALCSKQFTLTWAQRECRGWGTRELSSPDSCIQATGFSYSVPQIIWVYSCYYYYYCCYHYCIAVVYYSFFNDDVLKSGSVWICLSSFMSKTYY